MKVLTVQFDVSFLSEDQVESLQIALESQGDNDLYEATLLSSEVREVEVEEDDVEYH